MTRVIAYRRFVAARFEDDAGEPVTAFEARATPATRGVLARNGLLARPREDGIELYYRLNPEASPALLGPIASRVRMSFALHLVERDFFDRHLPDLTVATGAALALDNLDGAGAIAPDGATLSAGARVAAADGADLVPRRFPVHLDLTASSPASVEARAAIGGALAASGDVEAPAGASAAHVELDVTGTDGVVFRVAEVPPGPVDRRAYADDETSAGGAAGVVDLYWETAQTAVPEPDGVVYRAVFERR